MRRKDRRIPLKQKRFAPFFIFRTPRIKLVGNILERKGRNEGMGKRRREKGCKVERCKVGKGERWKGGKKGERWKGGRWKKG